tara:strand:+ start:1073 stop:1330 length:258 start_codon:yes stop_codon:yes gene_type:complete
MGALTVSWAKDSSILNSALTAGMDGKNRCNERGPIMVTNTNTIKKRFLKDFALGSLEAGKLVFVIFSGIPKFSALKTERETMEKN